MSANLDLVCSIYADFERGDFSRADWADPQIEYVVMDGPSPGRFTGLTEIATGVREILSPWKDLHDMIDEYRELDDERVLVLLRADLRGKTSGLGLDASWTRGAEIVHIKQGRVTRIVKYFDRDRALADLGLDGYAMPEKSTTPDPEEALRRGFEAVNRGDFGSAVSMFAPEGVWEFTPLGLGVLEGGPLMGHDAIRKSLEDLTASFRDFEFESEDFHDLGSGVTFNVLVQRGMPHGSDGFVESRLGVVAIWRDGRVARATSYKDVDEARAAAERLAQERG